MEAPFPPCLSQNLLKKQSREALLQIYRLLDKGLQDPASAVAFSSWESWHPNTLLFLVTKIRAFGAARLVVHRNLHHYNKVFSGSPLVNTKFHIPFSNTSSIHSTTLILGSRPYFAYCFAFELGFFGFFQLKRRYLQMKHGPQSCLGLLLVIGLNLA